MSNLLVLTAGIILGICLTFPLVFFLANKFKAGVFLMFLALYWNAFFATQSLDISILLYPEDVVFSLLLAASVLRLPVSKGVFLSNLAWIAFGALLLVSFITGVIDYGTAAGVNLRNYFYIWVTVIYFLSFHITQSHVDSILRSWLVFTGFLMVSVILRWLVDPAELGIDWLRPNSESDTLRVVSSYMALIIAEVMMVIILLRAKKGIGGRWHYLLPILIVAVVVLQHRSVWLSTMVALLTMLFILYFSRERFALNALLSYLLPGVIVSILGLTFLGVLGAFDVETLFESLSDSVESAVALETTAGERLYSWILLLEMWQGGGGAVWFFGFSFGTEFIRDVSQEYGKSVDVVYAAHNFYVETLLYTGLIGLTLFLATYFKVMYSLYRRKITIHPFLTGDIVLVLLVMQLVYFISYSGDFAQAMWLGLAMSLISSTNRTAKRASGAKSRINVENRRQIRGI